MAQFTELLATAIANADSRDQLTASRARIVAAADDARRRFVRDLHDGAQQRLVLALARAAEDRDDDPAGAGGAAPELSEIGTGMADLLDDLRELSRGIHPAILSEGGLGPALRRSPGAPLSRSTSI